MSNPDSLPADELVTLEQAIAQRNEAIAMLADWVVRVDVVGTSWDDWDEGYKNAWYRPCGIRSLLDAAIAETRKEYER
jgi:hypothetical protein